MVGVDAVLQDLCLIDDFVVEKIKGEIEVAAVPVGLTADVPVAVLLSCRDDIFPYLALQDQGLVGDCRQRGDKVGVGLVGFIVCRTVSKHGEGESWTI